MLLSCADLIKATRELDTPPRKERTTEQIRFTVALDFHELCLLFDHAGSPAAVWRLAPRPRYVEVFGFDRTAADSLQPAPFVASETRTLAPLPCVSVSKCFAVIPDRLRSSHRTDHRWIVRLVRLNHSQTW